MSGSVSILMILSEIKKPCAENRMAEIASPASDPRSLRRHYPHQVQGVVQLDLSAIAAPPRFFGTNQADERSQLISHQAPDGSAKPHDELPNRPCVALSLRR